MEQGVKAIYMKDRYKVKTFFNFFKAIYMITIIKSHEQKTAQSIKSKKVEDIINSTETVNYALHGVQIKLWLYLLIGLFSTCELALTITFYALSFAVNPYIAVIVGLFLSGCFHYLLHHLLISTALAAVFSKANESKALKSDINTNIFLSFFLLCIAACSVFFVGKNSYSAFRSDNFKPQIIVNSTPQITSDMLTNKNGKISGYKMEQLAAFQAAKTTDTKVLDTNKTKDRAAYDAATEKTCNIVGSSAFVFEFLLALLAFAIATAKYAAAIETLAEINKEKEDNELQKRKNVTGFVVSETPQQIAASIERKSIGFEYGLRNTQCVVEEEPNKRTLKCQHCEVEFEKTTTWHKYCGDACRIAANELRTGKKLKFKDKKNV